MLTRYFSGNIPKPEQRLLAEIQDLDDNYAELLACIKRYPSDVIRQCCDAQGNTVLQMVLMKHSLHSSKRDSGNGGAVSSSCGNPDADTAAAASTTSDHITGTPHGPSRRRWSMVLSCPTKPFDPATNLNQDLPKLLYFLIHSVYPAIVETDDFDRGPIGLDVFADGDFMLPHPATHYNSLVRLPHQTSGQLPLHTACASRQAVPLSALVFLVEAFPKAVQSPDFQGNLPLHAAAQHTAPLDVLKFLVQQYPDAAKILNEDGNLPLHLAAAAETYKEEGPTILDNHTDHSQRGSHSHPLPRRGVRRIPSLTQTSEPPRLQGLGRTPSIAKPLLVHCDLHNSCDSLDAVSTDGSSDCHPRGVRRIPSLDQTPKPPRLQGLGRTPSIAKPLLVHCDLHNSCDSLDAVSTDGSSDLYTITSPFRGLLSRHCSGSSVGVSDRSNSPVRRHLTSSRSVDSHNSEDTSGDLLGFSSTTSRASRNTSTRAPPVAAFCKKPLSEASVQQRDVVRFLVECWPESVQETNGTGQTAEQMATGSAVSLVLRECRTRLSEKNGEVKRDLVLPVHQWEQVNVKSPSLFMATSLSSGMIKTKRMTTSRNK